MYRLILDAQIFCHNHLRKETREKEGKHQWREKVEEGRENGVPGNKRNKISKMSVPIEEIKRKKKIRRKREESLFSSHHISSPGIILSVFLSPVPHLPFHLQSITLSLELAKINPTAASSCSVCCQKMIVFFPRSPDPSCSDPTFQKEEFSYIF